MSVTVTQINDPIASIIKTVGESSLQVLQANFTTGVVTSSVLSASALRLLNERVAHLLATYSPKSDLEPSFADMMASMISAAAGGSFEIDASYVAPVATVSFSGLSGTEVIYLALQFSTDAPWALPSGGLGAGGGGGGSGSSPFIVPPPTAPGVTVLNNGLIQRDIYKVTVGTEQFIDAAPGQDVVAGSLPAEPIRICAVYINYRQIFRDVNGDVCSITVHTDQDSNDLLDQIGSDETGFYGLTDMELGTQMREPQLIQAAYTPGADPAFHTWNTPVDLVLNVETSGENLGDGVVTTLTAGLVDIYVVAERLP